MQAQKLHTAALRKINRFFGDCLRETCNFLSLCDKLQSTTKTLSLCQPHTHTFTQTQKDREQSVHPNILSHLHRHIEQPWALCCFTKSSQNISHFFPCFTLSHPGLNVVTVVCGPTGPYSAHRSCRDSWIMEIIFMAKPHGPLLQILNIYCEIRSKQCQPRQQQPLTWAKGILTAEFAVLPHRLPPHAFTGLGFSTFGVLISCSPPIYQQDEVAL